MIKTRKIFAVIFALVGLSSISEAAFPITGYVQTGNTTVQPGGFNISTGTVGQFNVTGLTSGQCVSTGAGGLLTTIPCGSGGGGSIGGSIISSPQFRVPFYNLAGSSTSIQGDSIITTDGSGSLTISNLSASGSVLATSATVNGVVVIISTNPPIPHYQTIENPVLFVQYNAAISPSPAGSQSEAIYGDFLSTSGAVSPSGDGIGVHGRARETSVGNGQLIGVMGEVFGQGNATAYSGLWGTAGYASDLTAGTTANIEGLRVIAQITNLAGTVPRSTGTLIAINIPDFSNGTGAANKSWVIYANGGYPSFFRGFMGFGQRLPSAPLHVQVTTNTQFGLVIASGPVSNVADVGSSNNTFTVTNTGVASMRGFVDTAVSTLMTSQNPAGFADSLNITYNVNSGVSTRATGLRSNIFQGSTSAGALSVAVAVQGVSSDTGTTNGNGSLEGLDGRGTGAGNAPQYSGAVMHGNWQSDLAGGTTSTIVGLQITNSMTLADGVTTVSTGTLKQLYISDPTGSGDSNQSWSIYSTSRFPMYLNNFLGIGDKTPSASLSVAASTNTTYSIAAGSVAFFNGTLPTTNYNFTVTNDGQVTARTNLSLTNRQAVGVFADPETITLTRTSTRNNCIGFHDDGANPLAICQNGNSITIGSKNTTTGGLNAGTLALTNDGATTSTVTISGSNMILGGALFLTSATTAYMATFSSSSASNYSIAITTTGHLSTFSVIPTTSSCGTGAGFTGTDTNGFITPGTAAGGCTVTFGKPYKNAPVCTVSERTQSIVNALSYTATTTALTITQTSLSSIVDYICVGVRD